MQINTFKTLLLSLFLTISFFGYATVNEEGKTEETEEENAFDVKELITHHITDSHSFHVYGSSEDHFPKALTISLPVLLWTNNGLVTFMSSEFHHDLDGNISV